MDKICFGTFPSNQNEAHYIRKHNNYDVSNLKDFLKTMVSFIECELLVEKALQIERK